MKWWKMMAEKDEMSEGSSAPVVEEAAPPDDSNIWDDLLDDEPEIAEPEVEAAAEPAVEVGREPEPTPVVEEKPKVEETPKAEVVEQRVEVAQTPPAPVVSQPVQPQIQPGPTPDQILAYRQQVLTSLEQQYAMPEEEATALQVEPEKVLPKLAARLHANILDHVMRNLAQQAPMLVAQQLRERNETQAAEDAFFNRWQDLRPHAEQVQRVAQMWRQMYPQATMQEAIEGVGQAARALLGMGAQTQTTPQAAPLPPTVPARPAARGAPMRQTRTISAEEQAFADLAKSFEEEY